jgi:hypothetical protein
MAWSNVGPIVDLAPGATVTWGYSWAGLADQGLQFAGPHTGSFAHPGALGTAIAFDQAKTVEGINQASYQVSIRNVGSSIVRHNLAGGGLK